MDFKAQLTVIGILGVVLGLVCLLVPAPLLDLLGMEASPSANLAARFFGGSTVGWGVLGLAGRGVPGRAGLGAIAGAFFVGLLLGTALALWGTVTGAIGGAGWVAAGATLLLAVSTGIYRFTGRGS